MHHRVHSCVRVHLRPRGIPQTGTQKSGCDDKHRKNRHAEQGQAPFNRHHHGKNCHCLNGIRDDIYDRIADCILSANNIIVEAVKKAETGNDVIVRLYECAQRGTQTTVRFYLPFSMAYETNLLEENVALLPLRDGAVVLTFQPFEIKTLRMVIK